MLLHVNRASEKPVYLQIAEALRAYILNGGISRGTKLTERRVARLAGVSRKPVSEAFEYLAGEGLLCVKANSGAIVSSPSINEDFWHNFVQLGRHMSSPKENRDIFRLMEDDASIKIEGDKIASTFSPHLPIVKAMEAVSARLKQTEDMQSCGFSGLKSLKRAICKHMLTYGISTEEERIVVTQGTGESLMLICAAIIGGSVNFYYETPSFLNTVMSVQSTGCNMHPVPMDEEGISHEELLKKLRKTGNNILYIQPTNHLPTGTHMTKRRRDQLLSLACCLRMPVIENDMFRDFYYDGFFPRPMKAFDKSDTVVYIGSLLSSFMGFKISWIIAPLALVERIKEINTHFELAPNNVTHMLAEEMLSSGYYYKYLKMLSPRLVRQYNIVQELLDKYMSGIALWRRDYPSFFIWIAVTNGSNIFKRFTESREFLYFPGVFCDPKDKNHLRLNIFGVKEEDLEKWIKGIAELLGG